MSSLEDWPRRRNLRSNNLDAILAAGLAYGTSYAVVRPGRPTEPYLAAVDDALARMARASATPPHLLPTNQKGPSDMNEDWPFYSRPQPVNAVPNPRAAILKAKQILAEAGVKADIVLKTPKWEPGDVVIVRHDGPNSVPYTYVRGSKNWPGERFPKTDEQMNALYADGKVKPVLAHGGVPFAPSRLP